MFLQANSGWSMKDQSARRIMEREARDFFNRIDERYRKSEAGGVPALVPEGDFAKKFTTPKEPELSYKDSKKKSGKMKEAREALKKEKPSAEMTKYSGYILQVYEEKRDAEDEEEAPEIEKKEIFTTKINPNIFRPDYFGKNFEYVYDQLRHMQDVIEKFSPVGGEYDTLTEAEKAAYDVLVKNNELAMICFHNALRVHNIYGGDKKLIDSGLNFGYSVILDVPYDETKTPEEGVEAAINEYAAFIVKSNPELTAKVAGDVDKSVASKQGELDERIKDAKAQCTLSKDRDYYYAQTYRDVEQYLNALDDMKLMRSLGIDARSVMKALADFMSYAELQKDYRLKADGFADRMHKYIEAFGDPALYSGENKAYYDELMRLKQENYTSLVIYNRQVAELKIMLDNILLGNKEENEVTKALKVKYNISKEISKQEREQKSAEFVPSAMLEKDALLKNQLGNIGFKSEEAMNKAFEIIRNEPFRMLLEAGQTEKNEALILMMIVLHKEQFGKDSIELTHIRGIKIPAADLSKTSDEIASKILSDITKTYVKPELDSFLNDGPLSTKSYTKEELIAAQPEFLKRYYQGSVFNRLDEVSERFFKNDELTIGESINKLFAYYKKEGIRSMILNNDALLQQARAASLLSLDLITEKSDKRLLMPFEKKALEQGAYGKGSREEQIKAFARAMYETGVQRKKLAMDGLCRDENVKEFYRQLGGTTRVLSKSPHTVDEMVKKAEKLVHERMRRLEEQGVPEELRTEDYVAKQLYKMAEGEKGQEDVALGLAVHERLMNNEYRVAGDEGKILSEAFFRSFAALDRVKTVRYMEEKPYVDMMRNLSAGAYFDKDTPKEEVDKARKMNKSGIRTYYDQMRVHYEMLEQKYGYELPDLPWIVAHRDEWLEDFIGCQVDFRLITRDPYVFKENTPGDARLLMLVDFYNLYGAVLDGFIPSAIMGGADSYDAILSMDLLSTIQDSKNYLIEHPRDKAAKKVTAADLALIRKKRNPIAVEGAKKAATEVSKKKKAAAKKEDELKLEEERRLKAEDRKKKAEERRKAEEERKKKEEEKKKRAEARKKRLAEEAAQKEAQKEAKKPKETVKQKVEVKPAETVKQKVEVKPAETVKQKAEVKPAETVKQTVSGYEKRETGIERVRNIVYSGLRGIGMLKPQKMAEFKDPDYVIEFTDDVFVAGELESDVTEKKLFGKDGEPKLEHVKQSNLTDCYLISTLAGMVMKDPAYIKNILVRDDENPEYAQVRLYDHKGDPQVIRVKKTRRKDDKRQLWIQMVEKAALVMIGSMQTQDQKKINAAIMRYPKEEKKDWRKPGFIKNSVEFSELNMGGEMLASEVLLGIDGMMDTIGSALKKLDDKEDENDIMASDILIGEALEWSKRGKIVTASTDRVDFGGVDHPLKDILRPTHVYLILGDGDVINGRKTVRVRDPYMDMGNEGVYDITYEDFARFFKDVYTSGIPMGTKSKDGFSM